MVNKKIIITGGAGFIGSHLVAQLVNSGNEVIVVDTLLRGNKIPSDIFKKIEFHKADVRDKEYLERLGVGVDHIFHLAAILGVDIVADNPVETMETEVEGMLSVANCAITNNIDKIIYTSTSGVYGHTALEKSVTEDIMIDPKTSYAMAKRYNEIYLAALYEEKGINGIALRYFNVYGSRQDNRMVIPRFIEQAKSGKPITVFGDGNQTRDFTWIDDTIKASVLLAEKVNGFEIFNIANEDEQSILSIAEKVKKIANSDSEIVYINAPKKRYDYEIGRRFGSSEKLFKHIGYKPDTNFEVGFKQIMDND